MAAVLHHQQQLLGSGAAFFGKGFHAGAAEGGKARFQSSSQGCEAEKDDCADCDPNGFGCQGSYLLVSGKSMRQVYEAGWLAGLVSNSLMYRCCRLNI